MLRQYIYADNGIRLAMKMNGQTMTYHYNGQGDVIALTNASGDIVAEYQYDAWGNVLKSETKTAEAKSNPYGYAGYMYDAEIQQYYLMARYYVPEQGVFTAYDPDPGDEDDPQTMNGYNYANNNPVIYVDPDGHWVVPVLRGIAKYGPKAWKGAKKAGKWVKKTAKKAWNKVPYRIHKVGRIKGQNKKDKGYMGFIYSKKKKNGKRTYRSWEFHTPHNNHGWHLQSNKYSRYKGKWNRSSKGTIRITIKKAKNWSKKK